MIRRSARLLLVDVIELSAAAGGGVVLPLLATQILWINLVTDGAPALALGADPADPAVMTRPPRPRGEGVITRRMWAGIYFVGVVMAAGTLLVLDMSLPGGLIDGSGTIRYARTMAFTTLMMFQLFNAFNARSDERSAFEGLFEEPLALGGRRIVAPSPCRRRLRARPPGGVLGASDWLLCTAVASSALWLRELCKVVTRTRARGAETGEVRATVP